MQKRGFAALLIVMVVLAAIGLVYLFFKSQSIIQSPILTTPLPSSNPTSSTSTQPSQSPINNEILHWKTYQGGAYKFSYPPEYILKDSDRNITLSDQTSIFLTITALETLNHQNIILCSNSDVEQCTPTVQWQEKAVSDILVDGRNAKSFYFFGGGPDNDYHAVEVISQLSDGYSTGFNAHIGDIKINPDSARQKDLVFMKILSTFEFSR